MLRARRPEDELNPALAAVGTPYDSAAAGEGATQVQQALMQLTADARAVVVLRHFGDCRTTRSRRRGRAVQDGEVASPFGEAEAGRAAWGGGHDHDRPPRRSVAGAARRRADARAACRSRAAARRDEAARLRAGELEALVETLNVLEPVIHPRASCTRYMAHVNAARPGVTESQTTATHGGLMRTKVLWGLAAAAAIVLASFG